MSFILHNKFVNHLKYSCQNFQHSSHYAFNIPICRTIRGTRQSNYFGGYRLNIRTIPTIRSERHCVRQSRTNLLHLAILSDILGVVLGLFPSGYASSKDAFHKQAIIVSTGFISKVSGQLLSAPI
jgi:hypothetical protein